ncbi:MAG: orotidine 5'-phosphate decarboxylase [Bacteroidetes bacterium GWC2_33_15]|nr:MAG: orotidine 5'-phosphate decarboxylase [Bacteroidetes bacterium GWA2_33_15]OFX50080.1 MAG: orotidine 5'-phosphate decarboxylase [Bacteroidetes bacterium GWC2_33_15]OFX65233.1 MAG: orotidine 5'-phosphate decarboxylase [Bacteroidetes bacterium GWB2_32_14]OFX70459.1 MAG: orotidine 5'-phosphate decarboxylase [Bacteroidetes bacterium GWD2_33_33]HAN19668.1 orotidine-5'-phosphate decarboxylase [Bacteroidales bacterium]
MDYNQLVQQITKKRSFLCVGLDTDITKIPGFLIQTDDPIFEFNKRIIDATAPYTIAIKLNTAFYEANGVKGWISLEKTINYIRLIYPSLFIIADAKRGDIGNTSKMYARAFYEQMSCDAITIAPYMGKDSVSPFLEFTDKWVILLAITSNESATDFQTLEIKNSETILFETVLEKSKTWGTRNNLMYVVGATQAGQLKKIRKIIPEHFLLVPGVGTQGGDLNEVAQNGMNNSCGLLVNSSRAIIYADKSKDFDKVAAQKAKEMQQQMASLLKLKGL